MDGMLSHIEELLEAKNVFERKRKNNRIRALGILLYHYRLSLRKCRSIISGFDSVSHETVRKWYHKADTIFTVGEAYREIIAVDEAKMKINGTLYILWAAIDIQTYEILGVMVTKGRSTIEAYSFLKYILKRCTNQRKILVIVVQGISLPHNDYILDGNMLHSDFVILLSNGFSC